MPAIHATKFLADQLSKPASAESKKKLDAASPSGGRPAAYPMDAVKKDNARTGGTPAAPKDASSGQRSAKPAGLNSDAEIAAFTRGASKASPPSNKAKANGAPKLSNFGKAFKSARSAGKSEFTFGGKKYNTKLKGE